ncbi:MAG: hypothetical protein HY674_17155 [Chloroflexi bacterium]|nr:hypothetical protein [Chloroflexota bacterium]
MTMLRRQRFKLLSDPLEDQVRQHHAAEQSVTNQELGRRSAGQFQERGPFHQLAQHGQQMAPLKIRLRQQLIPVQLHKRAYENLFTRGKDFILPPEAPGHPARATRALPISSSCWRKNLQFLSRGAARAVGARPRGICTRNSCQWTTMGLAFLAW